MRSFLLATAVSGVLALPALAQPSEGKGDDGDRPRSREEMREHFKKRLLNAFDKDGDGKLSDEERKELPEGARTRAIAILDGKADKKKDGDKADKEGGEKAEKKKDGEKKKGDGDGAKKKHDKHSPGPDGRGSKGGPHGERHRGEMYRAHRMHGPDRPSGEFRKFMAEALFNKFDADKDDKLSREEFNKLGQFVHEHMPHPGPRGGHAMMVRHGRGPDGPPGGRGDGMRRRGPGGPDGPPRGDGPPPHERRMGRPDGDGPRGDAERGDRNPGPRGPRGDGPRRGPRPGGPHPDGPSGPPPGDDDQADDAV